MTLSRTQILALKKKMELSFLESFHPNVQDCAYEFYLELQSLRELHQIDLPETLTQKISSILDLLNSEITNNETHKDQIKNLSELLDKEVQKTSYVLNWKN
uniref:Uncharacterized protein n=1 Tax=Cacopsylla melanoneura TaxID=428564 RepID=A0A8D8TN19_9HEMI